MTTRTEMLRRLEAQNGTRGRYARVLTTANARVAAKIDRRSQRLVARLAKHASSWSDGVFMAGPL